MPTSSRRSAGAVTHFGGERALVRRSGNALQRHPDGARRLQHAGDKRREYRPHHELDPGGLCPANTALVNGTATVSVTPNSSGGQYVEANDISAMSLKGTSGIRPGERRPCLPLERRFFQCYGVSKYQDYVQNSSGAPVVGDNLGSPTGAYSFGGLHQWQQPGRPDPCAGGGAAGKLKKNYTLSSSNPAEWASANSGRPRRSFVSKSAMDTRPFRTAATSPTWWPTSVLLNLAPGGHPPVPAVTGGTWDPAGNLVVEFLPSTTSSA